ncbi:DUF120 domain-containing protein [Candidatus Woesearchaeota archaeon]|nr:DUF120 domain-containing protein [Candidatus Woesearchaeota archaeon]
MKRVCEITGTIINGLGKGSLFIPLYETKIEKVLHFKPFQGTLNLALDQRNLEKYQEQIQKKDKKDKQTVPPFQHFGKITLVPVTIKHIKNAAIIIPEKTTHSKNIVEIIADQEIKKVLHKKENETLTFSL